MSRPPAPSTTSAGPRGAGAPTGPAAFAPDLTATLRDYLVKYRSDLDRRVLAGAAGLETGRAFAKAIDGLMSALLPATQATLAKTAKWVDCSLAAVGSYGRGVLAPRSDVDVRIIVDHNAARAQEVAEALLYPLWDAGLHVGHQVMDVEGALSLARDDLATATSLLDLRTVGGDARRIEALVRRALDGFFTAELGRFLGRLREEQASRHERYGGSLYLLEPDVKSGAGGLRDLDLARWAARARYHVAELSQLVPLGVLLPREAEELREAEAFLWQVRARLHVRAGRRSDRITFDAQEELGKSLEGALDEPDAVAAERFMQRYYGHARTIARMVERVLDVCEPPRKTRPSGPGELLAPGVRTFDAQSTLESPAQLADDPALAMRLYHAAMRRGMSVYPYARDAVARVCHDPSFCEGLRRSPEAARLFLDCLVHAAEREVPARHGAPVKGSILRELHDVGLLLAMVPEFHPVVGRVHHDIYHVYTVDVHSVAAVDRLRALQRGDLASEHKLACRLAGDVARPLPLYVALLLHDVGKGQGGAGHSERGALQCRPICERLGLSAEEVDEVAWLIREHLTMYHVATRRDLEDPGTVGAFAQTIRQGGGSPIERLQKLYLLTVADISTTSPTAMTSWKARMLDDLFLATSHHLASEQRSLESSDQALARVRAAAAAWPGSGGRVEPFLDAFLAGMPKFYLAAHDGAAVAAHAAIARRRGAKGAIVGIAPRKHPDAMTLCVVAADRPGLLAKIAAAIAASRLEILTAHIFVRPLSLAEIGGSEIEAVDLFDVRRSAREGDEAIAPLTDQELARLEADLQALLDGAIEPHKLLHDRRGGGSFRERPSPAVETEVEIDDRASRRFTVIDVYAKDRPGLLFTIANALHELGLSIARSKIATEGARAADSFYVTELDGTKVGSPSRQDEIARNVTAAIERLAREGLA